MALSPRHLIAPGVVVALLGFALAWAVLHTRPGIEVGDRAPAYSAWTLDGREVALGDFRGRPVLLNVWATWCGPCRVEMPSIQRLYDAYRDRGLAVLAVSVDVGGARDAIRAYVEELGLTFTILHDPGARVSETFRTRGVPETLILDGEGRIVKRVSGATHWDSPGNRALMEHLLTGR